MSRDYCCDPSYNSCEHTRSRARAKSPRVLMTKPHDGHPDTEVCPGCLPHALREAIVRLLDEMGDPMDTKHLHPQAAGLLFQLRDILADHPTSREDRKP